MKIKNIYLHTVACNLRQLDAQKIYDYLKSNNYNFVKHPEDADYIIYVTCAFSDEAKEIALNNIRELQKYDAELIVAGCLPDIEERELKKIFNGRTISTKNLENIDRLFPENTVKFTETNDANIPWKIVNEINLHLFIWKVLDKFVIIKRIIEKIKSSFFKLFLGNNSKVYEFISKDFYNVRVSWGCVGNCSYCAIKKAVGSLKSKPLEVCLDEFKKGLQKGYKDFFLSSDDTGAYGMDIGSSFPELLDKITEIPGDYNIYISGLNPRWLVKYVDDLERIISKEKIVYICVPIQTGSNNILKLMNRYSDTEKIKDALLRLKKVFSGLSLDTHYILGFPSETEHDFQQSLDFIKEADFNEGLVLRFSCKTGTKSEKIEPKIDDKVLDNRMKKAKKFFKKQGFRYFYLRPRPNLIFNSKNDHFRFFK